MILVTGATGTTGSEVVRQLAASRVPVRAFVRNPDKAAPLRALGVEIVVGDLDRPETLGPALEDVERLFLLSPADPSQVEQQGRAVEMAQRAGVQHIVKMSVLGADPDSPIALGRWHAQTEQHIEKSGLHFTHLRPHYFMQNTLSFAASIAAEGRIAAPMKTGRISLVDARDIAAVAASVLTEDGHESRAYDITGPESLSFADIAECITAAIGKPVSYADVPPSEAEKAMIAAGVPEWLADAINGFYGIFSAGHASDTTKVVENVTGKPARTYAQFARDFAGQLASA